MARTSSAADPLAALLALSGAVAVIAGAYGAHGATGKAAEWLTTGAHYQMIHAVAGLVILGKGRGPAAMLLFGAALFAGTLYAMAFGGPKWLGAVTPLGGLGMILGWMWIAVVYLRVR
jgi:uncharacterized membrane protein YgdD (TMEM256/DUF423 family)